MFHVIYFEQEVSKLSSPSSSISSREASSSSGKFTMKQHGISESRFAHDAMHIAGVEGLCCAYALEWIRSRLKARLFGVVLGESDVLDGKWNQRKWNWFYRLANKHATQFEASYDSLEPFREVATSYNLAMGKDHDLKWKMGKEERPQFRKHLYYISLTLQHSENPDGYQDVGHGFAMDCRDTPWLADWGSGIYECPGMTAQDVFFAHLALLNKAKDDKGTNEALQGKDKKYAGYQVASVEAYLVGLGAVKPKVPPKPPLLK